MWEDEEILLEVNQKNMKVEKLYIYTQTGENSWIP